MGKKVEKKIYEVEEHAAQDSKAPACASHDKKSKFKTKKKRS